MAAGHSRFVTQVPERTFEHMERHRERLEVNMTTYIRKGHSLLAYFLKSAFNPNRDLLRVGSLVRPFPQLMVAGQLHTPANEASRRLIFELPARQASEADDFIVPRLDIKTRTAYAIANLNLLNGLCEIQEESGEPLPFTVHIEPAEPKARGMTDSLLVLGS